MASTLAVRKLGTQGLESSAIGFGAMSLTDGFYKADIPEETGIEVLRKAKELGVTLINTAVFYGAGSNERLIGKAFSPTEDDLVIATKWGLNMDYSPAYSADGARSAVMGSIERTGKAAVDVLTLRGPVPSEANLQGIAEALKELVAEGLVRYIGVSELDMATVRAIHAVTPISVVELEWSLFSRESEEDLIPACRALGIGFMAYSPLGRGILAGRFKTTADVPSGDFRAFAQPRFQGENFEKNLALAAALQAVADRKGVTPGQLALAWLLAQGDDVVPIPGTKSIKYLEQNIAAVGIALSPEEIEEIEGAVPKGAAAGERY